MSYILDALKKAEAERQLGSAPGLHAAPVLAPPAIAPGRRIALSAGALVLGAGALALAWWQWPGQGGATRSTSQATSQPTSQPISQPASGSMAAVDTPRAALPAPQVDEPLFAPAPPQPGEAAIPAAPKTPAQEAEPRVAEPVPTEPAPVETPALEESHPLLRDLPESMARDIPQVAIGGYIYSNNPADRLLLVDKVLRREGDEVAPGLVLEKLLPKSAVFNHRGLRYQVPY